MYTRYFWQGIHHTYGHIRCAYTVLANPIYDTCLDPGGREEGGEEERD